MNEQKKIIWLEDHPELNQDAKNIIAASNFELIISENVKEFGKDVQKNTALPDKIAGFILDIVIPINNLKDLDMSQVNTHGGLDTGFAVLYQYIRNENDRSTVGDAFKHHPVLMLSTLSSTGMLNRYKPFIDYENKQEKILTTWYSKADSKGQTEQSLKYLQHWLKKLKEPNQ